MADEGTTTQQQGSEDNSGGTKGKSPAIDTGSQAGGDERTVPYHRFTQLNESYKATQKELAEIRAAQDQAEEERAQKQGEYQKLADKYKSQAQQEKEKRQQVEKSWERERRLNVWVGAASGVVQADAVVDAFGMLDEDDFNGVDPTDQAQMRNLAERLVERKPYLSDGPVGAGSGGSERQILGNPRSPNGAEAKDANLSGISMTSSGRMIFPKKRARSWK